MITIKVLRPALAEYGFSLYTRSVTEMLQDLLLYMESRPASRRSIAAALELARRSGARVVGTFVIAPMRLPGYVTAEIPQSTLAAVRAAALERAHEQEQAFRSAAAESGVEVEWRVFESDADYAVNGCARSVDLVVLTQPESNDPTCVRPLIDEVVLGSGRPVMMVPRSGAAVGFGEHVLVAWNDSRESTGAVHDALPMLKTAKRVVMAAAESSATASTNLDSIVAHLARHGVPVETRRLRAGSSDAGDALLTLAAEEGIDLLVMGAWGHSRLREMVLGGVTAHVIRHSTLPVFMSH